MVYTITHASDMVNVAKEIMKGEHPTYIIRSTTNKYYSIDFNAFVNNAQIFWNMESHNKEIANPYYKESVEPIVEEIGVVEQPKEEFVVETPIDVAPNYEVEIIRLTNEIKYAKEDLQRTIVEKEDYISRLTNELNARKKLEIKCNEYVEKISSLEAKVSELTEENSNLNTIVAENSVLFNKTLGELIQDIKEYIGKQAM